MKTFKNINSALINRIFDMTGFSYDVETIDNTDGTESLTFDCEKDAEKFEMLLKELN